MLLEQKVEHLPSSLTWDQAILSAISLTEGVIGILMLVSTSREAYEALESSFASKFTMRATKILGTLSKVRKLDISATAFFNKVNSMANTLTSIAQPLQPEEFTAYRLAGLDNEYGALLKVVSALIP
jgi:hypothetical protein